MPAFGPPPSPVPLPAHVPPPELLPAPPPVCVLCRARTGQRPSHYCWPLLGGLQLYTPSCLLRSLCCLVLQIQEDEEDEDVLAARDNAISSVLKICVFRTAQLTADEAAESMRMLLALLPLRHDLLEARAAHGLLLRLLTTASPLVLGSDTSNLPAALVALAGCMEVQDPAASGENDDELQLLSGCHRC